MDTEDEQTPLLHEQHRNTSVNQTFLDIHSNHQVQQPCRRAARAPQVFAALVACLGPLTFGMVMGYSSPTIPELQREGILDEEGESWFASVMSLGAMFGALVGGLLLERVGRRDALMACGLPYTVGWLMIISVGWSRSYVLLLSGRALCGLTTGVVTMAAPTYIAEIATPDMRGTLGNLFMFATSAGVLLTFVLGIPLNWQWLALACSGFATLMSMLMLLIPESPYFLASKGRDTEALAALRWLRGADYDHHQEYNIIVSREQANRSSAFNWKEVFTDRALYKPILITTALMMLQQCSGFNNFVFYAKPIFQSAGFEGDQATPEVIIGLVMVGATILSVIAINVLARRTLLLISGTVMAIGCSLLGVFYYLKDTTPIHWLPLPSYILYVAAFNLGWGPVGWTLLGELTPARVKGFAVGLAVFVHRTCAFLVTKHFLVMQDSLTKHGTFWVFGGVSVLGVIFVALCVPETKGKSLSEIEQIFEN